MERPLHIGISGSYGGLNQGDEAILQSIITQLRASVSTRITVFSRNAKDTRQRYDIEHAVDVRELTREEAMKEVQQLDLFILGGGGILYDAEARIYLRELQIAQQQGVPNMTYAVGVGPLDDVMAQRLVCDVVSAADIVTVRERSDRRLLEDIGVHREIIVTADPALLSTPESLPDGALDREHMAGATRLVAMSVREPGVAAPDIDERVYHALLANAADFIIDRYDVDVVFFPMERRMLDVQHSHAVISKMLRPQRAHVLKGDYTSGQLLSLIGHCDFAVGMRLHFLLFAALRGIPFVALPYSAKVSGLLTGLDMEMPPLNLVNAGRLLAYIDRSWDHKASLQAQVRKRLPQLKREARKTNRLALSLLHKPPRRGRASSLSPAATFVEDKGAECPR